MKHPAIFFGKPHEHAVIDLANPYILSGHVLCAAAEMPVLTEEDKVYFGDPLEGVLEILSEEKLVLKTAHGWVYAGRGRATEVVGLDQISEEVFRIVCDGSLLETMDRGQAFRMPTRARCSSTRGRLTQSRRWISKTTSSRPGAPTWITTPGLSRSSISPLSKNGQKTPRPLRGPFRETRGDGAVHRYKVLKNEQAIATENLDLPPLVFRTTGLWFTVPEEIRRAVIEKNMHFGGGLHGIEHAMIGVMPLEVHVRPVGCGGASTPDIPTR